MKKIVSSLLCCMTLSACQQKNQATEQPDITQEKVQHILTTVDCFSDTKAILSQIDQKSSIQQLAVTNSTLKKCIKNLNHTQIYQLLESTNLMYQRFLTTSSGGESMQGLNAYGYALFYPDNAKDLGQGDAATIKKNLPQRDQYLMDQVGKQYIQFLNVGEGYFELKQHPQYTVDMFAAYLPQAEAVFIQRMAKDNADILYSDAAIAISGQALAERALFWENYIKQYPQSRYIKDAELLLNEYQYLIFIGSENSPSFSFSKHHFTIQPETQQALDWLSRQPDTPLVLSAQFYAEALAEPATTLSDEQQAYDFVKQYMNLKPRNDRRDCHQYALCNDTP